MQQEALASKMKEENKAIRDEAEADLSTFYLTKHSKSSAARTACFKLYYL